jgi:hypothetical protein
LSDSRRSCESGIVLKVSPDCVVKAHQRVVRERTALSEESNTLFGRYWDQINTNIGNAVIRPITCGQASTIIMAYEWLASMPAVHQFYYGIFFDGYCAGAVVYSPEYAENMGVWDGYGFTGRIILLSRGACVHWAHPHSASKLIRRSMDQLPPKYEVVTATVDRRAGEVGTIYQACGFDYAGVMSQGGRWSNGRSVRRKIASGEAVIIQREARKERYFGFRGSRSIKKRNRGAIAHKFQPYPKRDCGG